ncbi:MULTISPECIES: hypothetical protein [Bacillus]|uniref:hypothetical protein n=1 Tax=Bacillus TaxID=1386 RepID=UPI000BB8C6D5|nr:MULTISPECIES: hypothetical protein [Bacillus]
MKKEDAIKTLTKCKRILETVDKMLLARDIHILEEVIVAIKDGVGQETKIANKTNKKEPLNGKAFLQDLLNYLPPAELLRKYNLNLPTAFLSESKNVLISWKELNKNEKSKFKVNELRAIYVLINDSAAYKKSWTKKALVEEIDSSVASLLRSERLTKVL